MVPGEMGPASIDISIKSSASPEPSVPALLLIFDAGIAAFVNGEVPKDVSGVDSADVGAMRTLDGVSSNSQREGSLREGSLGVEGGPPKGRSLNGESELNEAGELFMCHNPGGPKDEEFFFGRCRSGGDGEVGSEILEVESVFRRGGLLDDLSMLCSSDRPMTKNSGQDNGAELR